MRVHNPSYNTKFFDLKSLDFLDPLTAGIRRTEFTPSSLAAHAKNCLRMSQRPDTYLPVLKNVVPIPPRSSWYLGSHEIRQIDKPTFSTKHPKSIKNVQSIAKRLMSLVRENLAVELSGGLDTAIVIGVLRSIGFNPTLVGAISDRYEFRTERYIQEKISETAKGVYWIGEANSLPFAHLKETPIHPIPNKASLFYYLNEVTAKWASENCHRYVANGIGFDTILIDQIKEPTDAYFFDPINLDDGWANDYVFRKYGVHYVNVASLHSILKTIITMRSGQPEDPQKLWARSTFRQMIPDELAKYRYKASFGAVYDEGLEQAKSDILEICSVAHELTGIKELHPSTMAVLFNSVRSYDHQAEFLFLARLSYANWVHRLHCDNLILDV